MNVDKFYYLYTVQVCIINDFVSYDIRGIASFLPFEALASKPFVNFFLWMIVSRQLNFPHN